MIWHDEAVTSPRRSSALALACLLAAIPLLGGCLTKSTTVGDQFSGTVLVATTPATNPQKPVFDIPASMSGQVWQVDYPEQDETGTAPTTTTPSTPAPSGSTSPAPSPDGKVGSQLTFDHLSSGQFSQIGDIIASALPDPAATVTMKANRSDDIVRLRGTAAVEGVDPNTTFVSIDVTFGGSVVATNGKQTGDDTVSWTVRGGQNAEFQADAEYADPATAAVPSWTWFMVLLCSALVALVVYLAYQSRDRSARPGRVATKADARSSDKQNADDDGPNDVADSETQVKNG